MSRWVPSYWSYDLFDMIRDGEQRLHAIIVEVPMRVLRERGLERLVDLFHSSTTVERLADFFEARVATTVRVLSVSRPPEADVVRFLVQSDLLLAIPEGACYPVLRWSSWADWGSGLPEPAGLLVKA